MKIVKALVIIMGVLIVLGMGLLIYGFVTRLGKAPAEDGVPSAARDAAPLVPINEPAAGFGDVPVSLEVGEIVIDMQAEASRLLVRTKTAEGTEVIRVFDLSTGSTLGRFVIGK